jgi:cytochrome c biogenesis protein CcdA
MTSILQKFLTESPFLAIFVVAWVGAIASMGSCTLVRVPIVLGYVAGASDSRKRSFLLTLLFVLGSILSYMILGMLFGVIGNFAFRLVRISKYVLWILGALLFLTGLLISGLINLRVLSYHHHIRNRFKNASFVGAFLFGSIFALLEMPACPCCGALLIVIAGIVISKGSVAYSTVIFVSFALGQSIPLLAVGLSAGLVKYLTSKIARFEGHIRLVAGNVLMVLGIYFVIIA